MSWNRRYRIASYLRSSLWIVAMGALVVEQLFAGLVHGHDFRVGWAGLGLDLDGARAMFNTVITLALSFLVFTFGSLLIAIQVAGGQYTPRIIATTLLCDNVIRYTVALLVFTLLFAVKALNRIGSTVPQLVTLITGVLGILCLAAFLFLIEYAARLLRPVSLVNRVGEAGLRVIEGVYPEMLGAAEEPLVSVPDARELQRAVLHQSPSAIVLAINVPRLMSEAEKAKGVIEFAPRVGDFVGSNEPLFLLYASACSVDDATLRQCVIFGSERTLEQDPLFAFRILVDIAIKALSPAINDPTTAVLAMDQLQRLLREAGRRNLRTEHICDQAGNLRLILRTPNWDDFVHLACSEIRFYGASNLQIARRLRAMIVNLAKSLPAKRHPSLRREFSLLDRMLERCYVLAEDLALSRIADTQGIGGSTDTEAPHWAG